MKLVYTIILLCAFIIHISANVVVLTNDTFRKVAVFYSMMSDFGDEEPQEAIQGFLIAAEPIEACTTVHPPPPSYDPLVNWIALIRRGNCTFSEKVYTAQKSNFSAVIVFNNISSDVVTMHCEDNCDVITIPSVFVGVEDGLKLMKDYQYNNTPGFIIWISIDLPFSFNSYFIPFVVIVVVCFVMMAGFMLVKCIRTRRRSRRHRMSSKSLKKIPILKYKKADPYDVCAICLEEYEEGDTLRILPCSHGYHTKCVDPWLTKNKRVCPCCKRKVFAENEKQYDSDSDSDVSNSENTPLLRNNPTRNRGGGTFGGNQESTSAQADETQPLVRTSDSEDSMHEDSYETPDDLVSSNSHISIEVTT